MKPMNTTKTIVLEFQTRSRGEGDKQQAIKQI